MHSWAYLISCRAAGKTQMWPLVGVQRNVSGMCAVSVQLSDEQRVAATAFRRADSMHIILCSLAH